MCMSEVVFILYGHQNQLGLLVGIFLAVVSHLKHFCLLRLDFYLFLVGLEIRRTIEFYPIFYLLLL